MNVSRAYVPTSDTRWSNPRNVTAAQLQSSDGYPFVCRTTQVPGLLHKRVYATGFCAPVHTLSLDLVCRLRGAPVFEFPLYRSGVWSFGRENAGGTTTSGATANVRYELSTGAGGGTIWLAPLTLSVACDEIALKVLEIDNTNAFDFFLLVLSNNGV
jgi:hypothetical protein